LLDGRTFINVEYVVDSFEVKTTKFGVCILCKIFDLIGERLSIFMPRSVKMTMEQCDEYNARKERCIKVVYQEKLGKSFIFKFV